MIIDKCRYIAPIVAGIFAKFCFSDISFGWVFPFVMFFILLKCESRLTPRQSFFTGYTFGIGYFGSSLSWVHLSFNFVGMESAGIIATITLVMYLSCYTGGALCLTTALFQRKRTIKHVFFACSWALFEYIRGHMFTGFPWNLIGYTTYDIPFFKQIASIVGIYGVSLIYMLIVCLSFVNKGRRYSVAITLCVIIYGCYIEMYQHDIQEYNGDIDVHIIQPCVDQKNKLNRSMFMNNLNSHLSISGLDESIKGRKKIIIWPEAAINTFVNDEVISYIASHIKDDDTYLFFGADRLISDRLSNERKIYNSAFLINKSGEVLATYDKKHLLPFGEFIPDALLNIGLRKVTAGMMNFSQGKKDRLIKVDGIPEFVVIICYEAAFPGGIVENRRPKWIVNITNDAWFAGSDEIQQHLKTTVFRAIEEGLPIFRCANTGVSCVIDRFGKINKILPENTYGIIKANISFTGKETVFAKFGNVIFLGTLLIIMFICILRRNRVGQKNYSRFS